MEENDNFFLDDRILILLSHPLVLSEKNITDMPTFSTLSWTGVGHADGNSFEDTVHRESEQNQKTWGHEAPYNLLNLF